MLEVFCDDRDAGTFRVWCTRAGRYILEGAPERRVRELLRGIAQRNADTACDLQIREALAHDDAPRPWPNDA